MPTIAPKIKTLPIPDQAYLAVARDWYAGDDLQLPAEAKVRRVNDGAWVDIQVFIPDDEARHHV